MAERPSQQKLTDEGIRQIILADEGTDWTELARQLRVGVRTIRGHRRLNSKRAIRIARELGLVAVAAPRKVYAGSKTYEIDARVLRGRARAAMPGRRWS